MIVVSMLLVIVGAITLVIGVFFGSDDNLTLVYVSIASCLLAGLFLVAGIMRNRPSRKPVVGAEGGEATWSGATAWPGTAATAAPSAPVLEREAPAASAVEPHVEIVTAEDAAPATETADDVVVVATRRGGQAGEAEEAEVVPAPARKATKKATAKKATAKKVTAKKATAKKATTAKAQPAKKATAAKTQPSRKAATKATKATAEKATAKKAQPAKKTAAKTQPAKKVTAKKVTPAKKTTARKTTRKSS